MEQKQAATSTFKKIIGVVSSLIAMIVLIFLYLASGLLFDSLNPYLADLFLLGFFIIIATIANNKCVR